MLIDRALFNSPEMLGMYRLPTVATFYHFESEEAAKQLKKEFSSAVIPLDGMCAVWHYDLRDAFIDNFVDIEINELDDGTFMLDFNVDGDITPFIPEIIFKVESFG